MKFINALLVILFLISCDEERIEENQTSFNNQVVVILSNPNSIKTNIGSGIDINTLSQLDWNTVRKKDTLRLDINEYRKLYVRTEDEMNTYHVMERDTLYIQIEKDKFNYFFANRAIKKYDSNEALDSLFKVELQKEKSALLPFSNKFIIKNQISGAIRLNVDFIKENEQEFKEFYHINNTYLSKKIDLLQKLHESNLISEPDYHYHLSMTRYEDYSALLNHYVLTEDNYYKELLYKNYLEKDSVFFNDYISHGYFDSFIKKFVLKGEQKTVIGHNYASTFIDYQKAYDSLPKYVSGSFLKYARLLCRAKINLNRNEFNTHRTSENLAEKEYAEKSILFDSVVTIERIENESKIDFERLGVDAESVWLTTLEKEKLTLKDLLDENKGNLIYIDFWASWCAPCRASFPDIRRLQEEYRDGKVVFLFISLDQYFDRWEKACEIENLASNSHNLKAIDYPNVDFFENINLARIPRYLLFDKKGELISPNAPSPEKQEIRMLFDKSITE